MEEGEWARKVKALQNNRPSKLEWVECRLPGLKGRRPPLVALKAGAETAPWRIAMAIVGSEGKPLAKQTAVQTRPPAHGLFFRELSCVLSPIGRWP